MQTIEYAIDPQAVKYLQNAALFADSYYSKRMSYIYELLERLESLSPVEHIPTKAVALICGLSAMQHRRFAFVEHPPIHTLAETSVTLLEKMGEITEQFGVDKIEIQPLKTITLKVRHHGTPCYFLVSGIGDFRIDQPFRTKLAPEVQQILEAESNIINKGISINPQEFNPSHELGLLPGIVSPFADLTRFCGTQGLRGLLYNGRTGVEEFVAVAMSATDTFIIDGFIFPTALNVCRGFYSNIPFKVF